MEYVMLYERHRDGTDKGLAATRYHVHAVLRCTVEGVNDYDARKKRFVHRAFTAWLKKSSVGVGIGWSCHAAKIENSHGGMVAAYICKYMTKACQDFGEFPPRMRRIGVTRGVGSPKLEKSPETWKIRAGIVALDVAWHEKVIDISTGEVIPIEHFDFHDVYPEQFSPDWQDDEE